VSDARTGNTLWRRHFGKDVPAVFVNQDEDCVTFAWRLYQPGAKSEMMRVPGLAASEGSAKVYDYVLEVLDLNSGVILNGMIFKTSNGVLQLDGVLASSTWLAVSDSYGRARL
jgi:hypothetical protein